MATVSFSLMTGIAPSSSSVVERVARIEIAAPLLGVAERQQHLRDRELMLLEHFLPGVRQADLADGRGRLASPRACRPARRAVELAASERDRAGGHEHDFLAALAQAADVVGQRFEPGAVQPAGLLRRPAARNRP